MKLHLHLLGGAGRIGQALVESLQATPLKGLGSVWIYCDSTKVVDAEKERFSLQSPVIHVKSYSAFSLSALFRENQAESSEKNVVMNLRGVNGKVHWLNQPLDSLELQIQACRSLIDSDLWMFAGVEIIHMSSQLCDLIESPVSLQEMCQGQESYRRPYMISRLHQEAMLSAYAFQHGIPTNFVRLPAVYGFTGDERSPWVLNSFCKQLRQIGKVEPRNPNRLIYLAHREPLIEYIRSLLDPSNSVINHATVRYLRPPMLQMSVKTLALLVETVHRGKPCAEVEDAGIILMSDTKLQARHRSIHLDHLESSIRGLLVNG